MQADLEQFGAEDGEEVEEEEVEEDDDDLNDEEEDGESEEDDFDDEDEETEDEEVAVPIDWTPPDCLQNKSYKIGLTQIAESIAGQLGGKLPVLVAQSRFERQSLQSWLPSSLQKKCAPASAFLMGLVTKCDLIFCEVNKTSLDKKKGLLSR